MAPLRWGIASTGMISFDFANALTTLPETDHQVVAVAARSLTSAEDFAKKFHIAAAYEGYESLMKDKNVDVVYIGSIVATHFEIAMMALENGKHVLCEKPLTINAKQSQRLCDTAKEKKLFFMVAIWSRFFESYTYLKQRIVNGDLGDVKEVNVEFGISLSHHERLFLKNGGGAVLDLGVYPIEVGMWAFQAAPTEVHTLGKLNENGIDVEYAGELQFPNGGVSKFKCSVLTGYSNTATIKGTKGQIVLHDFWCPIKITDIDGSTKTWELPKGRYDFLLKNSAGLRFEAEEVRILINEGKLESSSINHEDSLTIARTQDKLRKLLGVRFAEDDLDY